jgi:LysM repeat protein
MPEVTLSLPAALGFLALFLTIGAVLVFFVLRNRGTVAVETTPTLTPTITTTITATATITSTPSPEPSWTPLPDVSYKVASGDTCSSLALFFNVSVNSIILSNNLPPACDNLFIGQDLKIPQPTPTASPQPSATLGGAEATEDACEKVDYEVKEGDTLGSIASNYNVTMDSVKEYNGKVNDVVFSGEKLVIPLCARKPADGSTPTPTTPPPYPAPNLLLPMNGAPFAGADETVTLQWSSVGALRPNEAYAVTVEDITFAATTGESRKSVDYVTDTKFIVPASFRPNDNKPHLIQWWVLPVRQVGTSNDGDPIWQPAGSVSETRSLIWSGSPGAAEPTPTP